MSKKQKKRNKKYKGVNAKQRDDVVRIRKVNAKVRSNFGQWLHDHKTSVRSGVIVAVIILVIIAGIFAW